MTRDDVIRLAREAGISDTAFAFRWSAPTTLNALHPSLQQRSARRALKSLTSTNTSSLREAVQETSAHEVTHEQPTNIAIPHRPPQV